MGLRYVKTLEKRQWDQIRQARTVHPFTSVTDFVECTGINEGAASRCREKSRADCWESGTWDHYVNRNTDCGLELVAE